MEINKIKYFGEAAASYLIEKCKATFALITHKHTAEEVGADASGSASAALALANEYTDEQLATITTGDVVVKESEHSSTADTATNAENAINAEHATSAETAANATTATSATKATQDGNGNIIVNTYETKEDAQTKFDEAKAYVDEKILQSEELFFVDISTDNLNNFTLHTTYEEVLEAYQQGKLICARIGNMTYFPTTFSIEVAKKLSFIAISGGTSYSLNVNYGSNGTYKVQMTQSDLAYKTDDSLTTESKQLVDAINEIHSELDSHNHDDVYYTETEVDALISNLDTSITNITSGTTVVKEAEHATSADTATSATKATQDASGNVIVDTYETKTDAQAKLDEAKGYADQVKSDILGGAPKETLDTIMELATAFEENQDVVEALDAAISNKQDKNLIVTFVEETSGYTSDKTFEEIEEAIINNKTVIGKCDTYVYQLYAYISGMRAAFVTHKNSNITHTISIASSNLGGLIVGGTANLTDYVKTSNKTTALSTDSTDAQYPSAKAVVDYAVAKADIDAEISAESENPVQNKVVKEYIDSNKTLKNIEEATKVVEANTAIGFYYYLSNPLPNGWYYFEPEKYAHKLYFNLKMVVVNKENTAVDKQFTIGTPILLYLYSTETNIYVYTIQKNSVMNSYIYDIVNKTYDYYQSSSMNTAQIEALLAEKVTIPSTAEIGQILKVKAIDENNKPIEWECVDLPEIATDEDILTLLSETNLATPVANNDGAIYVSETGAYYIM